MNKRVLAGSLLEWIEGAESPVTTEARKVDNSTETLLPAAMPSKFMDYILKFQNYFYVTYIMVYMPITCFHSPKLFLCNTVPCRDLEYVNFLCSWKAMRRGDVPRQEDRRPFT